MSSSRPLQSGDPDARQCAAMKDQPLKDCLFDDARTLYESLQRGKRMSKDGPCLGWRRSEPDAEGVCIDVY